MDNNDWAYRFPLILEEHQYDYVAAPGQVEMTLFPGEQMILHMSAIKAPEVLYRESAYAFSLGNAASFENVIVPDGEVAHLAKSLLRIELDITAVEAHLQERAKLLGNRYTYVSESMNCDPEWRVSQCRPAAEGGRLARSVLGARQHVAACR